VEKEVKTAIERERQGNQTALFPVRLDDSVMQTPTAWAADIRFDSAGAPAIAAHGAIKHGSCNLPPN
jgi:hypothetical protein